MTNPPTHQGVTLREALEEFEGKLENRAGAYPTTVFHEPTDEELKKAHEALQTIGLTLDCLSASAMRYVATSLAAHFLPVKQALSHPTAPEQPSGERKLQANMTPEVMRLIDEVIPFRLRLLRNGSLISLSVLHRCLNEIAQEFGAPDGAMCRPAIAPDAATTTAEPVGEPK